MQILKAVMEREPFGLFENRCSSTDKYFFDTFGITFKYMVVMDQLQYTWEK